MHSLSAIAIQTRESSSRLQHKYSHLNVHILISKIKLELLSNIKINFKGPSLLFVLTFLKNVRKTLKGLNLLFSQVPLRAASLTSEVTKLSNHVCRDVIVQQGQHWSSWTSWVGTGVASMIRQRFKIQENSLWRLRVILLSVHWFKVVVFESLECEPFRYTPEEQKGSAWTTQHKEETLKEVQQGET